MAHKPTSEELDALIVYRDFKETSIQRINLHLTKGFIDRGYKVGVVGFSPEGEVRSEYPASTVFFDCGGLRSLACIRPLSRIIKATKPRAILSAYGPVNITTIFAARLAGSNATLAVSEHNQPVSLPLKGRPKGEYVAYKLMRYLYPFTTKIVCVSKGLKEDFVRYTGLAPDRFAAIYNPVVTDDLETLSNEPFDHPWVEDTATPLLVAVGRLDLVKNYDVMFRAIAKVHQQRPVRLIVLGEGIQRKNLAGEIKKLGLEDAIDMPGFARNPYSLMRRADLFIQTSEREALSNVIVEALACGTSVVSTDCRSGPREILKDGALGDLVPVGDEDAFVRAIIHRLDNPFDPSALIKRAQDFTVERAVNSYVELLFKGIQASPSDHVK